MKRFFSGMLSAAVLITILIFPKNAAAADTLPREFWALSEEFVRFYDSGDDDGIIESGKKICDLLEASPKNEDTVSVLATRYQDIALAYERKENFELSAQYYERYLPYAAELGWEDGMRIAREKILFYTPKVQMYMEIAENETVYGAKCEPSSGVLFGQVADRNPTDDSMAMVYWELSGNSPVVMSAFDLPVLERAAKSGKAIEVAVNFDSASITDLPEYRLSCLEEGFRALAPYSEKCPVFIRIAAEPDIWTDPVSPSVYIDGYRRVAEMCRRLLPNAALVWSVNHVSSWGINADDYYPGDDVVDWVGISLYATPYFLDKAYEKNDRQDEILFHEGRGADPVIMVKKVVEAYGDRKPIMLSECGVAHNNTIMGDSTEWAVNKMREFYGYIPMVYPQVKLISYFNNRVASETNDYSLFNSEALQNTYKEVTRQSLYIKNSASGSGTSYKTLNGGEVPSRLTVGTYVHLYDRSNYKVEYRVDGEWKALSDKPPYRVTLALAKGEHTVTASVLSADGILLYQNTAQVTSNGEVSILYNDKRIRGDVAPTVLNGRTMVPLRLIFSAMGAQVEWDAETRTVTSVLKDRTVRLTVDDNILLRNGEEITLDVAPAIISNRTLVPIRAVAEAFGADVEWDGETRTVLIRFDEITED